MTKEQIFILIDEHCLKKTGNVPPLQVKECFWDAIQEIRKLNIAELTDDNIREIIGSLTIQTFSNSDLSERAKKAHFN